MADAAGDSLARQLAQFGRELAEISRRAEERHQKLLADGEQRHRQLLEQGEASEMRHQKLLADGEQRHRQLLERGEASSRIFIDALVDIDASIKQSNKRSVEITVSIRDMRESIRANTQAVLSVLDRLGPASGTG